MRLPACWPYSIEVTLENGTRSSSCLWAVKTRSLPSEQSRMPLVPLSMGPIVPPVYMALRPRTAAGAIAEMSSAKLTR